MNHHCMTHINDSFQDNSSRLHDMQKVEEAELRITLENDLKLLQKLQVCIT